MKMEGGLVQDRRREIVGHVDGKVIKKKKVRRRPSSTSSTAKEFQFSIPLQQLYSYCKNVFQGPGVVPPPHDVRNLCHIIDNLSPGVFGLSDDLPFFKPGSCVKGNQRVTCTTVYKCRNFSLVIFFLPASAVIPLHNHPEMTVFSKLLLGKMHIKAYDWVDSDCSEQPSSKRLAKLKANSVFTAPCNTSVLYPTSGGNIHEFTAITSCAVLDVIGPPYSKEDGRDCSYYKEVLLSCTDGNIAELKDDDEHSYRWLEEIEMPENSKMDGIQYLGPRIIETAN